MQYTKKSHFLCNSIAAIIDSVLTVIQLSCYIYSRLSRAVATKHKTTKVTNTSRLIVYPVIPMQMCVCVFIPPEVKLLVQQSEHNHGTNFQVACVGDTGTNWLAMWVLCCGWITSPQDHHLKAWALI